VPTLEITYPEPGEIIELDGTCVLYTLIVVHITGIELVEPKNELVEGEGHWHGGPDLDRGYCYSDEPFCEGADNPDDYERYDGSGMTAGLLTLFAELQDNMHGSLGIGDEVEIQLTDPDGNCVDGTGS
jgi:hypothetical protein